MEPTTIFLIVVYCMIAAWIHNRVKTFRAQINDPAPEPLTFFICLFWPAALVVGCWLNARMNKR